MPRRILSAEIAHETNTFSVKPTTLESYRERLYYEGAAIAANMALVFVAFTFGPSLLKLAGQGTSKAVAKVASLFLAAISVAMIRAGITGMLMAG